MAVDIRVRALRKSYGALHAVQDVSFDVADGEILGILGPNGSGKTTTVECLQGLRHADGGEISVLGLDPRHQVAELRSRIGSQLQDAALPDKIRVTEAIRLFASVGDGAVDIDALLADWGLGEKRNAAFGSLSGGQRQRLFIALALVNRPRLVFLDEMTTGLDPEARREAWRLIERVRELGTTVVLVTHFLDEAERLCDRLVVIQSGRVTATGTPAEMVARHGGGVTATFTGDVDQDLLRALPGVTSVQYRGRSHEVRGSAESLLHLGHRLVELGKVPADLRVHQPTLEDAYFRLVGQRGDAAPDGGSVDGSPGDSPGSLGRPGDDGPDSALSGDLSNGGSPDGERPGDHSGGDGSPDGGRDDHSPDDPDEGAA
jgi:ABC-2 type transport system ATP-binding protein